MTEGKAFVWFCSPGAKTGVCGSRRERHRLTRRHCLLSSSLFSVTVSPLMFENVALRHPGRGCLLIGRLWMVIHWSLITTVLLRSEPPPFSGAELPFVVPVLKSE